MTFTYGTRQHWDSVATVRGADVTAPSEALLASMVEQVGPAQGKRVLDVGTGMGHVPIALVRKGASAVGIDVTPLGVERAAQHARALLAPEARERIDFRSMDAAHLAFPGDAFDAITCLKVIWCMPRAEPCLAEFFRVLAPEGKVHIQIYGAPEKCPLLLLGPSILQRFSSDMRMPQDFRGPFDFNPPLLSRLLEDAGFVDIQWTEHAVSTEITGSAHYWETLRSIAGSAYYAYTVLAEQFGEKIDQAWRQRAEKRQGADGTIRLNLSWFVCSATKPRQGRRDSGTSTIANTGPADQDASASAAGSEATPSARVRLRTDLEVDLVPANAGQRRYRIYDPVADIFYSLGEREMQVARLFDGRRRHSEIVTEAQQRLRIALTEERVAAFERKLRSLGIVATSNDRSPPRDPASGISYGPFKAKLMFTILRFDPQRLLDATWPSVSWMFWPSTVVAGIALIIAALCVVLVSWSAWTADVVNAYTGFSWLAIHYPIVVLSMICHEFGHAFACRRYGVRVKEIGAAVYLLLATGWAKPVQREWGRIGRRERMVTIIMGPFASLLFVSVAILAWPFTSAGSFGNRLAIIGAVSAAIASIPTVVPFFNGDTYLALTELFNQPGIRQRAFQYVHDWLRRRDVAAVPRSTRWLYAGVVAATLCGWALVWSLVIWAVSRHF